MQQAFEGQRRRNLIIAIVAGVVVLLFGLYMGARGFLNANSKSNDPVLKAKGARSHALMTVEGGAPHNVLEKEAVAPPNTHMPDDVYAWLKHLQKCEERKVEISGDQAVEVSVWAQKNAALGAGMGMMDPYDQTKGDGEDKAPGSYTKGKVLDLRPDWEELINYFHSVPPPAECVPIADDFDRAINQIPAMMGDLGDILNAADTDPQGALEKVKKMQNNSYGEIDRYFLRCDEKLTAICNKYQMSKWFNVKGDVMAGGMMGKFSGLPAGGTLGGQ